MLLESKLGTIVAFPKPPTHLEYYILLHQDAATTVGDYVTIPAGHVTLVGRVTHLETRNPLYSNPEFIQDHMTRQVRIDQRFLTKTQVYRLAKVGAIAAIGVEAVDPPESPPEPGEIAYRADSEVLDRLFGVVTQGLRIGKIRKTGHELGLSIDRLIREHLLIIGSTGSGKSYCNAILIEELTENGLPAIVIDPHGEFKTYYADSPTPKGKPKIDVQVCSPSRSGNANDLSLSLEFSSLAPDQIAEIAGIEGIAEDVIHLTHQQLAQNQPQAYDLTTFIQVAEEICGDWKFHTNTRTAVIRRLRMLEMLGILGESLDISLFVKPGRLTIVDLSGYMRERVRKTLAGYVIEQLFEGRRLGKLPLPVFVIVEEAHRFASRDQQSYSKHILQRVAREGRKFGVGLAITSQMARSLEPVIISQCGTQIVLRTRNPMDLDMVRPHTEVLAKSDLQMIPHLPTGTAFVSGVAVNLPCLVDIRERKIIPSH
ncbi:MAG: ATP-binding protein [Candidatus Heimdallarchaeota archaeon]